MDVKTPRGACEKSRLEEALKCSYKAEHDTHASASSSLSNMKLPRISSNHPAGTNVHSRGCAKLKALECTLDSLLYETRGFGCVVHLAESEEKAELAVESCRRMRREGVSLVILLSRDSPGFCRVSCLMDGDAEQTRRVKEGVMMSLVTSIQAACHTLLFYWSPMCAGYSPMFSISSPSPWVCYVKGEPTLAEHGDAQVLSTESVDKLLAVPLMYSNNRPPSIFVVGKTGSSMVSWNSLRLSFQAQSRPMIHRVYRSVAPSGRCFCCEYMVCLYRVAKEKETQVTADAVVVHLEPKFHQNVGK